MEESKPFWRNDTHNLCHLTVFIPNQFVPELVHHVPCSLRFVRVCYSCIIVYFYKLSVPYTDFLNKCHIRVFNGWIYKGLGIKRIFILEPQSVGQSVLIYRNERGLRRIYLSSYG